MQPGAGHPQHHPTGGPQRGSVPWPHGKAERELPVSQGCVRLLPEKQCSLREHPSPCGSGTQAQVLRNSETQKLSSSTSLNTAKSNLGLENIQSRCNQTDIPTVFPLNFMNKWGKKLPWVTQPLVVPSKKNELQGTYTTNQRNGLHRNITLLVKLGGKV